MISAILIVAVSAQAAEESLDRLKPGLAADEAAKILAGRKLIAEADGWKVYANPQRGVRKLYVHFDSRQVDCVRTNLESNLLTKFDVVTLFRLEKATAERAWEGDRLVEFYRLSDRLELGVSYRAGSGDAIVEALSYVGDKDHRELLSRLPGRSAEVGGEWTAGEGEKSYSVLLSQEDETVRGIAGGPEVVLWGTLRQGRLELKWHNTKDDRKGTARLTLSDDGKTLTGTLEEGTKSSPWTLRRPGAPVRVTKETAASTGEARKVALKKGEPADSGVELKELKVTHNETLSTTEGQFPGARFILKFSIQGHKDQKGYATLYFRKSDSDDYVETDWPLFANADGKLVAFTEFTPKYDETTFNSLAIAVPVKAFPKGAGEYDVELVFFDDAGRPIYRIPTIYAFRVTR